MVVTFSQSNSFTNETQALSAFRHLIDSKNLTDKLLFVFITPPLVPEGAFDTEVARRKGYYNFPPTGVMYLAAALKQTDIRNNISIKIVDLNDLILKDANENLDFRYTNWINFIDVEVSDSYSPVFVVSYMFGTTKECFQQVTRHLRVKHPKALILSGGVQATFDAEEILEAKNADIVSMNEGERQIQDILSILLQYKKYGIEGINSIPLGIKFIDGDTTISTDLASKPEDIDWDLSEFYDQINIQDYYKHGGIGAFSKYVEESMSAPMPYSAVLTKRGCRAHCTFCTVRTFNGKGLRLRSLDSVFKEIDYLYFEKGIRHIDWLDDDLLFDQQYNLDLFNGIAERYPDLVWTASNGLIGTAINEQNMEAMVKSGLKAFKIGVESGNAEVIKNIRKPTTLWRLLDKAELIQKYPEIFFSANFIIGFPEETFAQMFDTFTFAKKLRCDWSSFYVCQPLKGTDLYSSFQNLLDPRASSESYQKTINPGRSSARGEFAYNECANSTLNNPLLEANWDIFLMHSSRTFNVNEHNEIWFTFNLVANFLDSPCYKSKKLTIKLLKWLHSIHSGYPFDASMVAAIAHCYNLLDELENSSIYLRKFIDIVKQSDYWKMRISSFPEILTLAGIKEKETLLLLNLHKIESIPSSLIPPAVNDLINSECQKREEIGWK